MGTDLIPSASANGRWSRGEKYNPDSGNHKGHTVVVVNPAAIIKVPVPVRQDDKVVIELQEGVMVYVRCATCLMSWTFDQEHE